MDRNPKQLLLKTLKAVALRKESVDRNRPASHLSMFNTVALRKESVDRNICMVYYTCKQEVALRKESVDRNATALLVYLALIRSLSARRAWIEISTQCRL